MVQQLSHLWRHSQMFRTFIFKSLRNDKKRVLSYGTSKFVAVSKLHVMKTFCGSGSIAARILYLGTRWRWVVSFTPRPLYPRYPLDRRLGAPQRWSWRGGEEKNPCYSKKLNPNRPSLRLVTILTELSRFGFVICRLYVMLLRLDFREQLSACLENCSRAIDVSQWLNKFYT
jgi:hypothetical protein